MSSYIEFDNKVAFHPGYYIKEYIDSVGLTQEDFANRLGTTPKNISILVRGEQSISIDIANKLARLIGTSVEYWLNLQNAYDKLVYDFNTKSEMIEEKEILNSLNYAYFKDNFNLPELSKKKEEQVIEVRKFLQVSSLTVFKKQDMYVKFRKSNLESTVSSLIKANVMVQIATNYSLKLNDIPKFDKNKFIDAYKYALTLTREHTTFLRLIKMKFYEAGVHLIILPNITGSKINGATKKIGNHIMLFVNDRNSFSDSFWFTLFHEIGHILNGDYGVSLDDDCGEIENKANTFAEDVLINPNEYNLFIKKGIFTVKSIADFANKINRDPGIIVGRLKKDNYIKYSDTRYNIYRCKYKIKMQF
jgi:addiction module HigA family antidote